MSPIETFNLFLKAALTYRHKDITQNNTKHKKTDHLDMTQKYDINTIQKYIAQNFTKHKKAQERQVQQNIPNTGFIHY